MHNWHALSKSVRVLSFLRKWRSCFGQIEAIHPVPNHDSRVTVGPRDKNVSEYDVS